MTDFEVKKHLSFSHKCIILMILAFTFIMAFIPLWHLGVNNSLRTEMYLSGENIINLDAEDRAIRASISESELNENPQYLASVSVSY